jgi:hypothetical protein
MVKVFSLRFRFLSLIVICCLCGWLTGCPRQVAPAVAQIAPALVLEDFLTAREGFMLAQQAALGHRPDARLVGIEGQWVERGGRSLAWNYRFLSQASQEELTYRNAELKLVSPLAPNAQQAPEIKRWRLDSDAVLIELEASDEPAFPLGSMRLEDGIWQIRSAAVSWRLDAVTGERLP